MPSPWADEIASADAIEGLVLSVMRDFPPVARAIPNRPETDADGNVTVTGRIKDIIIRNMENISAKEVEDLLFEHPQVGDGAGLAHDAHDVPDADDRCGRSQSDLVVLKNSSIGRLTSMDTSTMGSCFNSTGSPSARGL